MKKHYSILVGLLAFVCSGQSVAQTIADGQVQIVNQSGNVLYVYNFPYGSPTATEPTLTLASSASGVITMPLNKPEMRIYFSDQQLSASLEKGVAPNEFDPNVDAGKRFSFAEYAYYVDKNNNNALEYTIDLSFLDSVSFPLTLKFDNADNKNKEWGIRSMASVVDALKAANEQTVTWENLVWRNSTDGSFVRIIGPNKTMQMTVRPAGIPDDVWNFNSQFPANGTYLQPNNWAAWEQSTTEPNNSGFVKAVHKGGINPPQPFVVKPDINTVDKFGYFLFPNDNFINGEFTNVPVHVHATITVYAIDVPPEKSK